MSLVREREKTLYTLTIHFHHVLIKNHLTKRQIICVCTLWKNLYVSRAIHYLWGDSKHENNGFPLIRLGQLGKVHVCMSHMPLADRHSSGICSSRLYSYALKIFKQQVPGPYSSPEQHFATVSGKLKQNFDSIITNQHFGSVKLKGCYWMFIIQLFINKWP